MSHDARASDDQHRHTAQHSAHSQRAHPRHSRTRAGCFRNSVYRFPRAVAPPCCATERLRATVEAGSDL
eukprot:12619961-Alexandrium_andersonii.AAC.1